MGDIEEYDDTLKIQGFDAQRQGIFLGKTFQATLDGGKHFFPKHITLLFIAKDSFMFDQISKINLGTELHISATINRKSLEKRLKSFELLS
jgi:hypothetical protein